MSTALQTVKISEINRDESCQSRECIDDRQVQSFAEDMSRGDEFPPPDTCHDGESHWLWDGFTRIQAMEKLGKEEATVRSRPGSKADAQWLSYSANKENGFRRKFGDIKRAVLLASKHEGSKGMSPRELAKHIGCSEKYVRDIRKLLKGGSIPSPGGRNSSVPKQVESTPPSRPNGKPVTEPTIEPISELVAEPVIPPTPKQKIYPADADMPPRQVDDERTEVPEELIPVFQQRGEFARLSRSLNILAAEIRRLGKHPAGTHIPKPAAMCLTLEGFARDLQAACPSVMSGKEWLPKGTEEEDVGF